MNAGIYARVARVLEIPHKIDGTQCLRIIKEDAGRAVLCRGYFPDRGRDFYDALERLQALGYTVTLRPYGDARFALVKSRDGRERSGVHSSSVGTALCLAIVDLRPKDSS